MGRADEDAASEVLAVGRLGRAHGVRGWLHVHSEMEPPDALLDYAGWLVGCGPHWRELRVCEARRHGAGLVARLEGCGTREDAERLRGRTLGLRRAALPAPEDDEFYWVDLIGAEVVGLRGEPFGTVKAFMETGANDVMVVAGERERLIPFLLHRTIAAVDVARGRVVVDWDPEL